MARHEAGRPSITRRSLLAGAAAALVPARSLSDPLIIRPEMRGVDPRYAAYATVGPYTIPESPISFKTARSNMVVFHPQGAKSARLVVFSHGALADPLTYAALLQHWASHGFVVAAPLHKDAVIQSGLELRRSSAAGIAEWQIGDLLEDNKAWRERTDACSACLDAIPLLSKATGIRVMDERPVIAGHGYGSFIAQLLLGARVKGSDGRQAEYVDTRFFSGILMAPQGAGVMRLDKDSWAGIANPLLSLIARNERDFTGQAPEARVDPYRLSKAGYKHLGLLKGGDGTTFSGRSAGSIPEQGALFTVLKAITTGFLHAYSSYDEAAFADMGSDFFERMSLGMIDEARR